MSALHILGYTSSVPSLNRTVLRRFKYVSRSMKVFASSPRMKEQDLSTEAPKMISCLYKIERLRKAVKSRIDLVDEGDISMSAYDTAWVALVEDLHGGNTPQFPSSLKWIADNQLPDGSWGDVYRFSAYDRLVNTLACAIALRRWNSHPQQSEKGFEFVNNNIRKLENERLDHMTIGFEVVFPALMDLAKSLVMEVPYDFPVMQQIDALRTIKLQRIPRDVLHTIPTTLLFSLEAFPDLDWEKLLKLQFSDGSFFNSPSSTAFALARTKDNKCLNYIEKIVQRFDGGVPVVYPVDLFARNWAIDRLHRLGVSRYFETELKELMSYVYRHWTERGISWAKGSLLSNADDTAMGWRLLRLYGYDVSADVFQHFRNGDEFFTFPSQTTESVTSMFQLYRASQFLFPGEKILEDAKEYSYSFLVDRHSMHQLFDKWLICKDLPGEIAYALDMPWYASLPRIETRSYLEQYGGESDSWIGKVFYMMNDINNNDYLELAKLDYNYCQAMHQLEWNGVLKWYTECNLEAFGISRENILSAYFVASASIFEPERSKERLAWAKTSVLIQMFSSSCLEKEESFSDRKEAFVNAIDNVTQDHDHNDSSQAVKHIMMTFIRYLEDLSSERYACLQLCDAWKKWLMAWEEKREKCPEEAQLLVRTILICSGCFTQQMSLQPQYQILSDLANKICRQLKPRQNNQLDDDSNTSKDRTNQVDKDMQELGQQVLLNSPNDLDSGVKQTFLMVCKSFYYRNMFCPEDIKSHIDRVLFKRVD